MTLPFTQTLGGHCSAVNQPNFNTVVSQETGRLRERERDGETAVSREVRTHTVFIS